MSKCVRSGIEPRRAINVVGVLLFLILSAGCASERPIYYQIKPKYTVHDPQFALTVGNLLGPPLLAGNKIETLRNGVEIFPAMLEAIREARKSVTFETYIYWSGEIGQKFTRAFCERARAGVKVHVLIDAIGGDRIDKAFIKEMKNAGVQVYEYHPLHLLDPSSYHQIDHRTHRKILVVDGTLGFTGGVGIAEEWTGNADSPRHWRDNHYRVQGPVVGGLQTAFVDNWMQTTGIVLDGDEYYPRLAPAGDQVAQVFRSSSTGGSENMQLLFLLSIACAGHKVRIESAYFVPDELTRRSLTAARKRGVDVEVIVPGKLIDQHFVLNASRAKWGELMKAGVKIYEYQPTMIHCKQLIVDDYWSSVGSSNMDNRSFRLNDEANLNVLDHSFAEEQVRVFEEDKKKCRQIDYEQWKHRPFFEKFNDALASILDWEL